MGFFNANIPLKYVILDKSKIHKEKARLKVTSHQLSRTMTISSALELIAEWIKTLYYTRRF